MDLSTIYTKTGRGARALIKKLPPNAGQILSVMSGTSNAQEIYSKLKKINEKDFELAITWLLEGGFIKVIQQEAFSNSIWAPVTQSAFQLDEISFDEFNQQVEDAAKAKEKTEAEKKTKLETLAKADEEARARAEAQAKAATEAKESAEAKKKAEIDAKEKAKSEARAAAEAKESAETEAPERAEAEAIAQAEVQAQLEALAIAQEEARLRAAIEAKEQAEAEAEAEALAEVQAKERAENEARERAEAEAIAQAEAQARLEALAIAQEEARLRAEIEAKEQAEAEAEAKALAETKAHEKAETKAKKKALTEARNKKIKENIVLRFQSLTKAPSTKLQAPHKPLNFRKVGKSFKQGLNQFFSFITNTFFTIVKYSLIALFVVLIGVLFINLRMLIKPIEKIASENIKETVNIEAVHASLFPAPHLILNNVSIGDSKLINAKTMQVSPDLSVLLDNLSSGTKTANEITSIEIENLDISQQNLSRAASWLETSHQLNRLKIKQILLKNAVVHLNGIELPSINSEILLTDTGTLNKATLFTADKSLMVDISRPDNNYIINIKAINWRSPMAPNLVFNDLSAKGSIENNHLTFPLIEGTLYNGQLKASLTVDMTAEWQAKGDFKLNGLNLSNMAQELKINAALDGALDTSANYTFNIDTNSNKIQAPTANAQFKVSNGNLKTIDLVEAMRNNNANIGGTTHFAVLSGSLLLNNQIYQFKNLTLQDNQLQAYGKVGVSAEKVVSGDIYSKILLKSNPIKAHLIITGTTNSLKLKK